MVSPASPDGGPGGALPDVNLLIGWAWPNHPFHHAARRWFSAHAAAGWASCAVTALGFIRLSSTPAVVDEALSPPEAADVLALLTAQGRHHAWDTPPGQLDFSRARTRKDVTDTYLIGLAGHHGGRLVTFDRKLLRLAADPDVVEVLTAT